MAITQLSLWLALVVAPAATLTQCPGGRCAVPVLAPLARPVALPITLPAAAAPQGVFVPGPGGCCSAACTCGCNAGKPCVCPGAAAGKQPAAPAGKQPPAAPSPAQPVGQPPPNFGVNLDKLKAPEDGSVRYSINGVEIDRREAKAIISDPARLEDDSALLRLTLYGGDDAARRGILDDLEHHAALAGWRGRLLVQSYTAPNPVLAARGFRAPAGAAAGPAIYGQRPDGTLLFPRMEGYRGAADLADKLAGRKVPPTPDVPVPPGPQPPAPPVSPDAQPAQPPTVTVPGWALGAVLGAVFVLFLTNMRARSVTP